MTLPALKVPYGAPLDRQAIEAPASFTYDQMETLAGVSALTLVAAARETMPGWSVVVWLVRRGDTPIAAGDERSMHDLFALLAAGDLSARDDGKVRAPVDFVEHGLDQVPDEPG